MTTTSTKRSTQLQHEIDEVLQARQKRAAKAKPRSSSQSRSASGIPSQQEYERNELQVARSQLAEIRRAPLLETMRARPALIGERIGWLIMPCTRQSTTSPTTNAVVGVTGATVHS